MTVPHTSFATPRGLFRAAAWLGAVLLLAAATTAGAEPPPLRIAVVDAQAALLEIPDGKKARKKLEQLAKKKKAALEKKKKDLQQKVEDFKRQAGLLTDAVRGERMRELQRLQLALQEEALRSDQELKKKELELLDPISEKLEQTIQAIAREKGYTIVLHKAAVAYHLPAYDITDEVVKRYPAK